MALVDDLIERQKQEQQSDKGFADHLGISRQNWNFLKNKRRMISPKTLFKVARLYPELRNQVLEQLELL